MTTIATFNVNSIQARLTNLLEWLKEAGPDIVCLQELKCPDDAFPHLEVLAAGYKALTHGQKTYNGVAILAKAEPKLIRAGLPGEPDDLQARYLEAQVGDLRVASIYLPNGNPVGTEKYPYKLRWMQRLAAHARDLLEEDIPLVLSGDFNVIPEPIDCDDPAAWEGDALFRPETRRAFRTILHLGFTDAFRALHPTERNAYSFWDYQAGAFQLDHGIRIDHHLLSPRAADRLEEAWIEKGPRGRPKASDHTPVVVRVR